MKRFLATLSILLFAGTILTTPIAHGETEDKKITAPDIYSQKEGGAKVLPQKEYDILGPEEALNEVVVGVINQVSNVFIGFSVLFIIVAGIQYVLAQGDEEKIKKAHKSIMWSVAGVILVMLSYTIIYIVNTLF